MTHRPISHRACALLGIALGALTACTSSFYSATTYRTHRTFTEQAYASFEGMIAEGPVFKPDVLGSLGPPVHVIAQELGEIFVYRSRVHDTNTINLNPAFFVRGAPSIPLWVDSDVSSRDDLLMVFFDTDGRVTATSAHRGIQDTLGSRAASSNTRIREAVE